MISLIILFSSCLKNKEIEEEEQKNIEEYIEETGLYFELDESGIYYHIVREGKGNYLSDGDNITISFTGTTIDETFFSSDTLYSFEIGDKDIIEGWNISAKLFPEGTIAFVIIPYDLAFGKQSVGTLPPYSTLVYEFRIISGNPEIEADTDFFETIFNIDSVKFEITNYIADSLYFSSYFDGIGEKVVANSTQIIEYQVSNFDSAIFFSEKEKVLTISNHEINIGVDEGLKFFNQGEMGKLFVHFDWGFGSIGNDIFPSYSNLIYEIRVLSDDLEVMEDSDLKKYIFENEIDALLTASGLYFIENKKGDDVFPIQGDTVMINYVAFLLSSQNQFAECDSCIFVLDSPELPQGANEGIKLMSFGGKATLLIPSSIGFGSEQNGEIPPFSTLIYEIELLEK